MTTTTAVIPRKGQNIIYTDINFKSGKALREAFLAGRELTAFQPGGIFPSQRDGDAVILGPHNPAPHSFYVRVRLKGGVIVAVKQGSKWLTAPLKVGA